jgi:ArsR family transcriptional regulator, arsenate/arsenite/antimonite-responsive transcriptional repressor
MSCYGRAMSVALPVRSDAEAAADAASAFKALADPVRARIVDVIRRGGGEVCQCHLQPLFDISQPTLSHHLRKLTDAGLLTVTRRGRWAHYALDPARVDMLRRWLG